MDSQRSSNSGSSGFEDTDSDLPEINAGDTPTSIVSLYCISVDKFERVVSASLDTSEHENSLPSIEIEDQLGRLRVWAGTCGAYRAQDDHLSLDYRLRKAPELHRLIRDHFNDLNNALTDG